MLSFYSSMDISEGVDLVTWTRILGIIISLTITPFLGSCEVDNSTNIY